MFGCNEYNQAEFGIFYLVMSMGNSTIPVLLGTESFREFEASFEDQCMNSRLRGRKENQRN